MKFIKEIINSPEFKEFITTGVKKVKGGIKNFFKNLWNKIFKKKK